MSGLFDESSEITVIERIIQKIIHKKKKYIFKPSVGSEKEIIVAANGPHKLMPGAGFSIDFAIAVTCDKFQYHMPLNRQVDQMERKGLVSITAKTLYKLSEVLSNHARRAGVIEKIRHDILNAPLAVHADETPWPILDDHDSDGYLWTICNMAGAYYRFETSRSGKIMSEQTEKFTVTKAEYVALNLIKGLAEDAFHMVVCATKTEDDKYVLEGSPRTIEELTRDLADEIQYRLSPKSRLKHIEKVYLRLSPDGDF